MPDEHRPPLEVDAALGAREWPLGGHVVAGGAAAAHLLVGGCRDVQLDVADVHLTIVAIERRHFEILSRKKDALKFLPDFLHKK